LYYCPQLEELIQRKSIGKKPRRAPKGALKRKRKEKAMVQSTMLKNSFKYEQTLDIQRLAGVTPGNSLTPTKLSMLPEQNPMPGNQ